MQFDVIIGNPPYQLASNGGTRDIPIYHHFIAQAKKLDPRYLVMVIPSRWMASGLGLSEFRNTMLSDQRIRELVDFPSANDVFPGVSIKAGVCYFLWDRDHTGKCNTTTVRGNQVIHTNHRDLSEFDVFVRDSRALSILRKVQSHGEPSINTILARDKEFGWTSNFKNFHDHKISDDLPIYYIRAGKRRSGFIFREEIQKSIGLIDTWKVLVPEAYGAGEEIPHQILGKPIIAPSPSVCTQSYLFFYTLSKNNSESIQSYYTTRFFRFLVSLRKITQHATHSTYKWVPIQSWNCIWTDEMLYTKYNLSAQEVRYIESVIRPMDLSAASEPEAEADEFDETDD